MVRWVKAFLEATMTMELATPASVSATKQRPSVKLGEELPLFCEKCGYGLQGALPVRCEHCNILQFHCPECGHHQPINTLRPAAQRIIGRLRAVWLTAVVFFKLNFFGWLLFAWFVMGMEWSYSYEMADRIRGTIVPRPSRVSVEMLVGFAMFAMPFGAFSRMFLLRWRKSWAVGLVLMLLVLLAVHLGASFRFAMWVPTGLRWSPDWDWLGLYAWAGGLVLLGAMLAWPFWVGAVRILLPSNTAEQLIRWQRSLSDRPVAALARD
jgi:hypothetical protein